MMDAATGHTMDEVEHIRQSCRDILTTRLGTRVMRRHYGSLVPELLDQPANQATRLRLMSATVMALHRFEPRLLISEVKFSIDSAGNGILDINGIRRSGQRAGNHLSFKVPVR